MKKINTNGQLHVMTMMVENRKNYPRILVCTYNSISLTNKLKIKAVEPKRLAPNNMYFKI
jgi:hypothetical protein